MANDAGPGDTTANPSAAPIAGGATTPASRFGGPGWQAQGLKLLARIGRRVTAFAYRRLRDLELARTEPRRAGAEDHRVGAAGAPSRTAGAPPPKS